MKITENERVQFRVICAILDTTPEQLTQKSKVSELVELRAFAAVFMRHCDFKYKNIGFHLKRDHSSIMNLVKRHVDFLKYDEGYRMRFEKFNETFFLYSAFFNCNEEAEGESVNIQLVKINERLERIEEALPKSRTPQVRYFHEGQTV